MRAEDGQIISPSELASTVQPGMQLEMSIVMRRGMDDQKKCPRCHQINSQAPVNSGWIEWRVSKHHRKLISYIVITAATVRDSF